MQIVVMAGGLGTRMSPLTDKIPKSLLSVNDRAFVDCQLSLFKEGGIERVVFCVGYLGEMIQEYVGNGSRWGINVCYSWEEAGLLGTAGALKNASILLDEYFLLTWGDSYVRANYRNFLDVVRNSRYDVIVGVYKNQNKWDKSNIDFRDGKVVKYNKNQRESNFNFIDVGLSAFKQTFLKNIPAGVASLDDVWEDLSLRASLGGLEVFDRFYEIGSKAGYQEFSSFILQKE